MIPVILPGIFAVVAIVVSALTHAAVPGIACGGAAAVLYYIRDVKRHPRVRCRWPGCGGSGSHDSRLGGGKLFRRPSGDCRCCGGRKSHPRLALRLADPDRYAEIRAEIEKGKAKL